MSEINTNPDAWVALWKAIIRASSNQQLRWWENRIERKFKIENDDITVEIGCYSRKFDTWSKFYYFSIILHIKKKARIRIAWRTKIPENRPLLKNFSMNVETKPLEKSIKYYKGHSPKTVDFEETIIKIILSA